MENTEKNLLKFKSLFWDAFHVPALQSEKYVIKFRELEPLNDLIVGPLFSIFETGNCNYVFDTEERFKGINTNDQFFDWMVNSIKEYAEKVIDSNPETEAEEHDVQTLVFQTDIKMELAELAYEIMKTYKK
jgi:hypothetical protein